MKRRVTPLQRSLKYCRDLGMLAEKCEQRLPIPGKFITRDLFGLFDIIALDPRTKRIIGIQTTSYANQWSHLKKMREQPGFQLWHQCNGTAVLHAWRKLKNGRYFLVIQSTRPKETQHFAQRKQRLA